MLHTVTNQFLSDNYPTTRSGKPVYSKNDKRISIDPAEFRANLARKIEELHQLELTEE